MQRRYRINLDREGCCEGEDFKKWHVLAPGGDDVRLLCNGAAIGISGSIEVDVKRVTRGGITCERCLAAVLEIKAIRL